MSSADYAPVSKSRLPRWAHRLRASMGGYFWAPCPRCGREWGGHEPHGEHIPNDDIGFEFKLTCCALNDGSISTGEG